MIKNFHPTKFCTKVLTVAPSFSTREDYKFTKSKAKNILQNHKCKDFIQNLFVKRVFATNINLKYGWFLSNLSLIKKYFIMKKNWNGWGLIYDSSFQTKDLQFSVFIIRERNFKDLRTKNRYFFDITALLEIILRAWPSPPGSHFKLQ